MDGLALRAEEPGRRVTLRSHRNRVQDVLVEMADREPDIRNWKVIGLQNQEVGKVSELLFDEESRRVRYLIIQINGKPLNLISIHELY